MEKVFYETKPYLCLGLAMWANSIEYIYLSPTAPLAKSSVFALIVASSLIIWMRGSNRGYIGIDLKSPI